jgi:Co/Zn/Cd efflux system component
MAAHVCSHDTPSPERMTNLPRYRLILWVAVVVNAAMFVVELRAGFSANSLSLWADAIDFGGDALNYGMSLAVLVHAVWSAWRGEVPEPLIMGSVAVVALVANVGVAWMLYAFREGDANMRSVWLCSRNDAIGNVAVLAAAGGVLSSGSAWPDLLVASAMASLALTSGWQVLKLARQELAA